MALDKDQIKEAIAGDPLAFYGPHLPGTIKGDGAGRWKTACPFHADTDPSFTIYPDGRYHCYGCSEDGDGLDFLMKRLNLDFEEALREAAGRLQIGEQQRTTKRQEPTRYEVRDAEGKLLATHCRLDLPGGKKLWWEPKGVRPVTLPLWNTGAVLTADPATPVVVCEGEKACDALTGAGQLAVGTYGKDVTPCDDSLDPLLGRNVILWPDNDEVGRKHMATVGERLTALGTLPYLVSWQEAPPKGDAADFLAKHTAEELQALLADAVPCADASKPEPDPALDLIMPVTFAELEKLVAETSWAWPGYLPNGFLSIMFAPPAAGKSYVGLDLMRCISTGADWPDGAPNLAPPGRCLLIDYEGTQGEYLTRAKAYGLPFDMLLTLPPDLQPYLTNPASFDAFRVYIERLDVRFVLIDSWRDGAPGANEDSSGEVAPTLNPLKHLARDFNIPILLNHHATKKTGASWTMTMADARGSGVFGAAARLMLALDKPSATSEARVFKAVKRSAGAKAEPLGFEWGPQDEDGNTTGLVWTDPVYREKQSPKMNEAKAAIRSILQREALQHKDLRAALEIAGVKQRTGDNALAALREEGVAMILPDGRWGLVSPLSKAG